MVCELHFSKTVIKFKKIKAFPRKTVNYHGDEAFILRASFGVSRCPGILAGFTTHGPGNGTQPFAEVPSFQLALTLRKHS